MARRRQQWMAYQDRIDPARLVFIDETWTKTNMAPLRGWSPLGQRLPAKVPHGRWTTMTFLAALRQDRLDAPWLIDGPINGDSFRQYIDEVLIPTLRPGDIVCGFRRKSATHSDLKPATDSDLKSATRSDPSRPPIPI